MKNFYKHINKEEIGSFWVKAVKQNYTAGNAKVIKAIKLSGQKITADVKGEGNNTFNTEINIKKISDKTKEKFVELISSHPSTAFNISLGHIDEKLMEILTSDEFCVFPQGKEEFSASCSCGYPKSCQHLYAVVDALEKKINKNPLTAFTLRGIYLDELLAEAGYKNNFLNKLKKDKAGGFIEISNYENLSDFSFPKADIDAQFFVLPNNPLFFAKKDVKNKLKSIYETIDAEIESLLIKEYLVPLRNTEFYLFYSDDNKLMVFFTPPGSFQSHLKSKGSRVKSSQQLMDIPEVGEKDGIIISSDIILDYFLNDSINATDDEITESAQFIRTTARLALNLVRSLNFIPEVVVQNDNAFRIRYIPGTGFKEKYPELLTIFITHIVHKFGFLKASKFGNDPITNMFIKPALHSVLNSEGNNIALSIALWLDMISPKTAEESPVLRIEHCKDKTSFSVHLDISDYKNIELISMIVSASDYLPILKEILDAKGQYAPVVSLQDVLSIISYSSAFLMTLGLQVVIPKELNNILSPRILLKAGLKNKQKIDIESIFNKETESKLCVENLLDFSYEIAIGDEKLSREEFLELVKSADEIVKFKNHYILLKPEDIKAIMDKLNKPAADINNPLQLLQSTFSGFYNGMDFEIDEAFKRAVDDYLKVDEITLPKGLNGELRPYQERGFKWLYSNTIRGFGSCMADDMGLGKTIQVISLLLKYKEENNLKNPVLVVCPTTLVGNWYKECAKFAPSLKVFIYHGADRTMEIEGTDLVITTYGLLRRDIEKFKDKEWDFVIIDEAQNIKNPDAAQTLAVKSLNAKTYIAMTGTPVENRLAELWSIFDYINKGYLGNLRGFQQNYANIIEKNRDEERVQKLKQATAPFTLRRLKSDKSIITDLPEKISFDEYCYLSKEQAALYEKVLENSFKEMQNKSGIHRRGHIFKLITSLKQICNHPYHYVKSGKLSKELSGKTEKVFSIIEQIQEQNEKTIIFTQYKEMGDLLVKMLSNELQIEAPFFHGSVPMLDRNKMVDDFQTNDDIKLMIISLKAGGTGINLTAATNVIHYDLWWNPAVEDQATDRTYRIGQTNNVIVYRLITLGTFEEKIDEMIKSKKQLADLTVSTGENWITELSDNELRNIFSLSTL